MKTKNVLPKIMAILFFIISLASCEEDFNTIGSDILEDQEINAELDDSKTVISYSRKLLPVQTNNLPVYQLGIYNDPVYGKSTVNLLSQVLLRNDAPSFGDCTVLDSVFLYIPYFSEEIVQNNVTTYTLDSIYGDSPINISLFESGFFLRDLDPNSNLENAQNYYSNQGPVFENFLVNNGAENRLFVEINDFKPKNEEVVINDTLSLPPGLRVKLPTDFFKKKIIDMEGTAELINNNNFKEYFRGIYFKAESSNNDGNLFIFDLFDGDSNILNDARITLYYSFRILDPNDPNITCETATGPKSQGELELTFNGINVNVYDNELPMDISDDLSNPDIVNGEESLYLRGGDGIVTVIDLFGEDLDDNGVADELEILREKEWLINEANLIFYVDQNKVLGGASEPERLIIYDIKNSNILVDYNLDITSGEEPVNALNVHLGRLERGSDNHGDFYKIRITSHISNLINKDSTNVPLGLIVSQNVLEAGFQDTENIQSPGIEAVPSSSVVSPQGTVLYGNAAVNGEKRLKLQIYYTEPN